MGIGSWTTDGPLDPAETGHLVATQLGEEAPVQSGLPHDADSGWGSTARGHLGPATRPLPLC